MRRCAVGCLALLVSSSLLVSCRLGGSPKVEDTYTPIVLLDTGAPPTPDATDGLPDVPDPISDVTDSPDAVPCVGDDVGRCQHLDPLSCEMTSNNEGEWCCDGLDCDEDPAPGLCVAGECLPLSQACSGVDPDGCWYEVAGEGQCDVTFEPDGTPCGEANRRCLSGECAWEPVCPPEAVGGATAGDFHAQCAGNIGCSTLCMPDTCGCWLCDGPLCVVSGCDSSTPPEQTEATIALGEGWSSGPPNAIPADPAPTVAASASPAWTSVGESYPVLLLHLYQAAPPSEARWLQNGSPKSVALEDVAVIATRLLVSSVETGEVPCSGGEETLTASPTMTVLSPSSGDASTVEFMLDAATSGTTVVVLVRVLKDLAGQRAYEWIRLGGFAAPFDDPAADPQPLEAELWHPVPAEHTAPLSGLWPGYDWVTAIEASL